MRVLGALCSTNKTTNNVFLQIAAKWWSVQKNWQPAYFCCGAISCWDSRFETVWGIWLAVDASKWSANISVFLSQGRETERTSNLFSFSFLLLFVLLVRAQRDSREWDSWHLPISRSFQEGCREDNEASCADWDQGGCRPCQESALLVRTHCGTKLSTKWRLVEMTRSVSDNYFEKVRFLFLSIYIAWTSHTSQWASQTHNRNSSRPKDDKDKFPSKISSAHLCDYGRRPERNKSKREITSSDPGETQSGKRWLQRTETNLNRLTNGNSMQSTPTPNKPTTV